MDTREALSFFIILVSGFLLSGCGSTIPVSEVQRDHIIAIEKDGIPYPLTFPGSSDSSSEQHFNYPDHVKSILDSIRLSGKKDILIFVHGGMKGARKTTESSEEQIQKIDSTKFYPIFVNWESGFVKSLTDQLVYIRKGARRKDFINVTFGTLFSFTTHLLATVAIAPMVYYQAVSHSFTNPETPSPAEIDKLNHTFLPEETHIGIGDRTKERLPARIVENSTYLVPGVVKTATTPMVHSFGRPAWNNMLRRTQNLFISTGEIESPNRVPTDLNPDSVHDGGLGILMDKLKPLFTDTTYSITLIGHSMGTIILNELIRRYPDYPYSDIVYMGAACSINDFQNAIVPYLKKNKNAAFYNLTLHPFAERRERVILDAMPRGSLLEWIDNYIADPSAFGDFTLGKWMNAIKAFNMLPLEVRDQTYLKGFGIEDSTYNFGENYSKPQSHGDFNDKGIPFWEEEFWKIPKVTQ